MRQPSKRIHCYQNIPCVCLSNSDSIVSSLHILSGGINWLTKPYIYLVQSETRSKILKNSGFMKISQFSHVINTSRRSFRVLWVNTRQARHNLCKLILLTILYWFHFDQKKPKTNEYETYSLPIGGDDGGVTGFDLGDLSIDPSKLRIFDPDMWAEDDVHRSSLEEQNDQTNT